MADEVEARVRREGHVAVRPRDVVHPERVAGDSREERQGVFVPDDVRVHEEDVAAAAVDEVDADDLEPHHRHEDGIAVLVPGREKGEPCPTF